MEALSIATWPRARVRLLTLDARSGAFADRAFDDLPSLVGEGDLLVVNDAATLPGSLRATTPAGAPLELRLTGESETGAFTAVVFGAGSWRDPTEKRPAPEPLGVGLRLTLAADLHAEVVQLSPLSNRLVRVRFDEGGDALWSRLYALGAPIQYSYLKAPLALWHVQTVYAGKPLAAELPSAGHPLRWELLLALRARGATLARITHAAGISSTGDAALDAALPLPERYEVPAETVEAVAGARRVIAVGTSVVRALEGCARANGGALKPDAGTTRLRVGPDAPLLVVDGLLTGLHEPTASHFELLQAFARKEVIDRAYAHARSAGYLWHEFGDSNLIL